LVDFRPGMGKNDQSTTSKVELDRLNIRSQLGELRVRRRSLPHTCQWMP